MIGALEGLDKEYDQFKIAKMIKETEMPNKAEIELQYPDDYYDEVLDFDLEEQVLVKKKVLENTFSNKIMFLLQKVFNQVYVLGRTKEELDQDILKY